MKFSFIIPAYNEEKIIGKCINSIKSQTRKPDEIIVVDNLCTDNTAKIARKLGCRVVKESKKGISNARNKGAKASCGDILCFVDADGIVVRNWLEECEKSFLKGSKINAVVGMNIFSHKNSEKHAIYNIYTALAYSGLFLYKILTDKLFLAGNNFAIKKEVFAKVGGFESVMGEDYWLSKKFWKLSNHKGVFNPKMKIHYSSRGFDSAGYLQTLTFWVLGSIMKTDQKSYTYKNKRLGDIKFKLP